MRKSSDATPGTQHGMWANRFGQLGLPPALCLCVRVSVHAASLAAAVYIFIVTCVGRSKAPPIPLLYEAYGMANIECVITKLSNDDIILALAHPVMAS